MSDAFYNALCDHQHFEGYEEGYKDGYEAGKRDAASPWHRVEDRLPDDEVPVLAMLHNIYGRNIVLKLCHIGHHKRTTEDYGWQEYEGETEYDEENDCFWIPEGWWESNYHAYFFETVLVGKFLNNTKKMGPKITKVIDVSVPIRLLRQTQKEVE